MKKLIFLITIMFAVSITMAQNTTTVTQNGNLNNAAVTQTNSSNSATVTQTNNNLSSSISQAGMVNKATVEQTSTGVLNTATIIQVQRGSADNNSEGNLAGVKQSAGGGNSASIDQEGKNERYVSTNPGYGTQRGAFVNQVGSTNQAVIAQKGIENSAKIDQIGDENKASSELTMWHSDENIMTVYQQGNENEAYQKGDGTDVFRTNTFSSRQVGASNYSNQLMQGQFGAAGSQENYQLSEQIGDDNTVDQQMLNTGNMAGRNRHEAYQEGNDNIAEQLMSDGAGNTGRNNKEYITQIGDWNFARQEQTNNSDNVSRITQNGYQNTAITYQNGSAASGSNSVIYQDGDFNEARLDQKGGTSDIFQQGNSNIVRGINLAPFATSYGSSILDVDQIGNSNILELQQDNGASATVFQSGNNNLSTVIQN